MTERPLVLRLREAKEQITATVNAVMQAQGLPCFLIEPIVTELLAQVRATAQAEYERAKAQTEREGGEDNE